MKEQQRANITLNKDINQYQTDIETLLDEHDKYMKDKEAYLKTKRKSVKPEKADAPVVITKEVKQKLRKLGYSNADIKKMSVSQANKLVKEGTTKQEADKTAQAKETQSTALLKTKLLAANLGYKNADINKMSKEEIIRVLNNKIKKTDFVQKKPKEGKKKLGRIISTKGSKANLTQKKKIYKTEDLDGRPRIVEIAYKSDGSREVRYKTPEGDLINFTKYDKDNTLTDEQLIERGINDEVKPEFVEEITDINKLYSKKIIESKGLVREGGSETITKKGKKPLGKIISTKGMLPANILNRKERYEVIHEGEKKTVVVRIFEDGNETYTLINKDGDTFLMKVPQKGTPKEKIDLALEGADAVLIETITDVDKLYSKKQIEKRGLVREGDVETQQEVPAEITNGLKNKKERDLAEEVYRWLQTDEGNLDNNGVQYEVINKESGEVLFYRNPYIASASKLAGKSITRVKEIVKEMQRQHMILNPGLAQVMITNIDKAEKLREVKRKDKRDSRKRYSVQEEEESPTWERNIGAEKTLRRLLRGKNINLITYNYAKKNKQGIRYYGAAQGLSIYLDAKKASHDVLFEELGHIYLDDASNLPSTKALRKIIHKEPVFKKKLNEYWFRIEYKNPDGIGKYLGDLIDIE